MSAFYNSLLLPLGVLLLVSQCPGQLSPNWERRIDPDLQKTIDDYIQNVYLSGNSSYGMTVAIVQGDNNELLYSTGYGLANIPKEIPVTNKTQFVLGSISKGWTGLMVAKTLHEQFPEMGEAVLDTPIRELMPEVNFTLIDRYRSEQTTFRDLLIHSMCTNPTELSAMSGIFDSMEELLYRVRYIPSSCEFRHKMGYYNDMITMAGYLAARLVNKTYEEAMMDLWGEMGLHNTTLTKFSDDFPNMPERANPYFIKDGEFHPYSIGMVKRISIENPAGGLISTADDMSRYLHFHLNRGKIDGRQIIPEEVYDWLLEPYGVFSMLSYKDGEDADEAGIYSKHSYGLGLSISSYDGWEYIEHGGVVSSYRNQLSIFPELNIGIYTGMNVSPLEVDVIALHTYLFELIVGEGNGDSSKAEVKAEKVSRQIKIQDEEQMAGIPKEEFQKLEKKFGNQMALNLTGKYGSGALGDLQIYEKYFEGTNQTEFYLEYGVWTKGWLIPVLPNGGIYSIEWDSEAGQDGLAFGYGMEKLNFAFADTESITLMFIFFTGRFEKDYRFEDQPVVPWEPDSC